MTTVAVGVHASDPITAEGAAAQLSSHAGIEIIGAADWGRCEVLLVLVFGVTDKTIAVMRRACHETRTGELSIVLVTNAIEEHQVMRAIKFGLVSLLFRQETNFDQIAGAIRAARAGRACLPGAVMRHVIDQARVIQRGAFEYNAAGLNGLAWREIEVLKLLADGMDTGEVASKLNYSERTVKNITHGVVTRLKLRNRTHAVAFAMRVGLL
jgi:DNA-binding NarL/FixJ family response regulator